MSGSDVFPVSCTAPRVARTIPRKGQSTEKDPPPRPNFMYEVLGTEHVAGDPVPTKVA